MPIDRTRVRTPIRDRRLLRRMLAGAHPALPLPLDRASDWWSDRPPRLRIAVTVLVVLLALGATGARVRAAQARWGGPPVTVLVATDDIGVGEPPTRVRRIEVPPALAPPGAVLEPDDASVLAIALPAGTVLTERHLASTGPSVGLPADLRAVPIPVEEGWGVVSGGWVDVWVLSDSAADASQAAARSRPVLELREDDLRRTALVGLAAHEVRLVTSGLADGRVLLAHAPPPAAKPAAEGPNGG